MSEFWRYGYCEDYDDDDEDDRIVFEDRPLHSWIQREKLQKEFNNPDVQRLAAVCENAGQRYMKYVTSEVVMTDFDWRSGTFILEVLGDDQSRPDTSESAPRKYSFRSAPWCRDDVSVIAVWSGWALGYTIFHGSVAHLLLFNLNAASVEEVASWDLQQYWARLTLCMGRVSSQPDFACVLSPSQKHIVITGPPVGDSVTPATKVLDIQKKTWIKDICVPGFSWIASSAFHPGSFTNRHKMALICCEKYEPIDNYARPNVTGTLLNFDLETGQTCGQNTRIGVSSEILKFNHNGDLLFVRFNRNHCIAVLDADDFRCFQTIQHDVTQFPPNHDSFCTAYKLFPLLSRDDRKIATLQWMNNHEIMRATNIQSYRAQSLKNLCRQTIHRHIELPSKTQELAIPRELKEYLLWM